MGLPPPPQTLLFGKIGPRFALSILFEHITTHIRFQEFGNFQRGMDGPITPKIDNTGQTPHQFWLNVELDLSTQTSVGLCFLSCVGVPWSRLLVIECRQGEEFK